MEIFFATKKENNLRREWEFLSLTPGQRLMACVEVFSSLQSLPEYPGYKHPNKAKNNFEIKKKMETKPDPEVHEFVKICNEYGVRMLAVGAVAVNYYGYKRNSADIDFWIDRSSANLTKLLQALNDLGYKIGRFPDKVLKGEQNISLKLNPHIEIELIVSFNPGRTFNEAYANAEEYSAGGDWRQRWYIISYDDLIASKIKSGRTKDMHDVHELRRIRRNER